MITHRIVFERAFGHLYDAVGTPRPAVTAYISERKISNDTYPFLAVLVADNADQVSCYDSLASVPAEAVGNTRNDMYLASEAIRFLLKDKENDLTQEQVAVLHSFKGSLDVATKFIPTWVKIVMAIALGLGPLVGWKRIVITVGEDRKDPSHLRPRRGNGEQPLLPRTGTVCRSRRRMSYCPVLPERWLRMGRDCS